MRTSSAISLLMVFGVVIFYNQLADANPTPAASPSPYFGGGCGCFGGYGCGHGCGHGCGFGYYDGYCGGGSRGSCSCSCSVSCSSSYSDSCSSSSSCDSCSDSSSCSSDDCSHHGWDCDYSYCDSCW